MTGPGEGKIPIRATVKLSHGNISKEIPCDVYLHVKGYSLARVTHIDLESDVLNEIIKPKEAYYVPFKVIDNKLIIRFNRVFYVKSYKIFISSIIVHSDELCKILGNISSKTYVGGKIGGIFLGFHRDVLNKLEEYATKLGIPPKGRKRGSASSRLSS